MRVRKPLGTTDDLPTVILALARRGWTVGDLALATGGDTMLLERWLRGIGSISQDLRERVASALNIDTTRKL